MADPPPPSEWDIPRTPDDPAPDGTESVILIPPDDGQAPTTAPLPAVAAWGMDPGAITRPPVGGGLPSTAHLNPSTTSLPFPVVTISVDGGMPDHIAVEITATGGPATMTADWRNSDGGTVTDRQTITDDGTARIAEFAAAPGAGLPTPELTLHIETAAGGGETDIEIAEILAFDGSGPTARLVAMTAAQLLGGTMGITTAEAIALIDQLIPPARRIGALAGHAGDLVAVAADEAGLEFAAASATPADVDRRLAKLELVTGDLHAPPPATGWQTAQAAQGGIALFAYSSPPSLETAAAASGWAVTAGPTTFGDHPVARIAHDDDPQQARILVASEDGEQGDQINHWTALGPSGPWDYYLAPGSYSGDLRLTLQVTGSAAHIGASRYTGLTAGPIADGAVTLDALAAAVAARLNPA